MESGLKLWGIMTSSTIVLSDDAPTLVKAAARLAKVVFGARIQICDGVDDHVEIQAALDALPADGGEVRLSEGTYYIEVSLALDSNQTLRGCGKNTILTTTTAALHIITATGGAGTEKIGILIADFCVDGDAGGVASDFGILFTYVDYSKIHNVWSIDNGEHGICLTNSDNNIILGNACSDNGTSGIRLYNSSFYNSLTANVCTGNGFAGIELALNCYYNNVSDNICDLNIWEAGIYLTECYRNIIADNIITNQVWELGLELVDSDYNILSNNLCRGNTEDGILLNRSNHNQVIGNSVLENGQSATNTLDNIGLHNSSYNNIQSNMSRAGLLANKPKYGINIADGGCIENLVINNDLYDDGFGTASLRDAGIGSIIHHNRGYVASGEHLIASGALTAAAQNAMAFTWQNPHAKGLLIDKIIIDVTTGATAAANLDVALDADGTGTGIDFFDDCDLQTPGTYDSTIAADGGTQTSGDLKIAANGGADDWITGKVLDAAGTALVGKWYVYYTVI